MRRVWIVLHDVIAHPICGWLQVFGFDALSDWIHDATVHPVNYEDERWEPPK